MTVLTLLGVAFASAVIPVINLEVYLGALALFGSERGPADIVVLSLVAAVGQMVGKMLFYLAGRGVLTLPKRLKPDTEKQPSERRTRNAERIARWQERAQTRPWVSAGFVGISASVGIPPFAIVSVVAGTMRVPATVFVLAGLIGRWGRFAVVLAVVDVSAG